MAIMKFDPMRSFDALARRMGDIMGDVDKGVSFEFGNFAPRVDISEDDKNIFIEAEMPGVKKNDVKVSVNDDNVLTIKGKKERKVKEKKGGDEKEEGRTFIRSERAYGEFTRSFMLPENVKKDNIQAKYEDGTLNVVLEKVEPEKPKETNIEIS